MVETVANVASVESPVLNCKFPRISNELDGLAMKRPGFRTIQMLVATVWFLGSAILLAASLFTDSYSAGLWAEIYFAAVTVLSVAAFVAFGWDKWKAGRDGQRIPEKTLHMLAVFGGWPGAVLGQQLFRHKTVKPVFRTLLLGITILHIATVLFLLLRPLFAE